jgi:hypothetical protein
MARWQIVALARGVGADPGRPPRPVQAPAGGRGGRLTPPLWPPSTVWRGTIARVSRALL